MTICIPTYNRPDHVLEAIASCEGQSFASWEIAVSDDSPGDETEQAIAGHPLCERIHYAHNRPSLGQAANVNQLFDMVRTPFLVLLHDDDLLLPDAVKLMLEPLLADPSILASFGDQHLINHDGARLPESRSQELNTSYGRTPERAKSRQRGIWSALVQQFPNDGFMVRTSVAQEVRYRASPEVGEACDFEFGLRLAQRGDFYYLGKPTALARLSEVSIGTTVLRHTFARSYEVVAAADLPDDLEQLRQEKRERFADVAVTGLLLEGKRAQALQVWSSGAYGWKRRVSVKGLFHLLAAALPRSVIRRILEWRS